MSGEYKVRLQVGPQSYKTLPMDFEIAGDLAGAMEEVRLAFEAENIARNLIVDRISLDAHQRCIAHRRRMEERARELFSVILGAIPVYLAENPYSPPTGGKRPRKSEAA